MTKLKEEMDKKAKDLEEKVRLEEAKKLKEKQKEDDA